jgi:hypothetical protein
MSTQIVPSLSFHADRHSAALNKLRCRFLKTAALAMAMMLPDVPAPQPIGNRVADAGLPAAPCILKRITKSERDL